MLVGGLGGDTFSFAHTGAANKDLISDYLFGDGDKVDLSAILDGAFNSGDNVADFVRVTGSGTTLTIAVDVDGAANGQSWADVVDLSNTNTGGSDSVRLFFAGVDVVVQD